MKLYSARKNILKTSTSVIALLAVDVTAANAQAVNPDEIIVTATRRAESIQDIPLNVAYVGGAELEELNITDLAQLSAWVPGLHIADAGGREQDRIIVRGLNADASNLGGDNGTVAIYLGEIGLQAGLKLNDMKQIEALLGPQGTLYGAGTMAGAIKYIPNKPDFEELSLEVRADAYNYSQGDGISTDVGLTANIPLSENFAIRGSYDLLKDDGFIDYTRVVREIGRSNPDPDFSDTADVAENLRTIEDANSEETHSLRLAARWEPTDALDATLTYYGQFQDVDGRTQNGVESAGTGLYESASRVQEPNARDDQLVALEVVADLGFAELTSATGLGTYDELGNRDQTDLLVSLQYSYELFPTFTAITEEAVKQDFLTQEVRLVSTTDTAYNWIVGAYYNKTETASYSQEFTPYIYGAVPGVDDLEYDVFGRDESIEKAIFGEFGYDFTDAWQVTAGARLYNYEIHSVSDFNLPLTDATYEASTIAFAEELDFDPINDADGDGSLFKINTSYKFNDDVNVYGTISEGFRLGGSNGIALCTVADLAEDDQVLCALPSEANFDPDTTTNYEVGLHSQWLDGDLTLNGAAFLMDWDGVRLSGATENGGIAYITNGGSAQSRGLEASFNYEPSSQFSVRGNYAYTNAELTSDAPNLYPEDAFSGVGVDEDDPTICLDELSDPAECSGVGGKDGDRLPGSPEHQFSVFADYVMPLDSGRDVVFNGGFSYVGDILTRVGNRANGQELDAYTVANASVSLDDDDWSLTLYATNLFDQYAETNLTSTRAAIQTFDDEDGGTHTYRAYRPNVLPPRVIGLRAGYKFQ